MDQVQQMHNELVNNQKSFEIERQRFEKQQLEFEEMKTKLLQGGTLPQNTEESKDAGVSIAAVRKSFLDGGSGAGNIIAPIVVENNVPPSYVAARVKAHDNGGNCLTFRP